jgi:hypothetical protein
MKTVHRADAYLSEYRSRDGTWEIDVCKFTQAQADTVGAVLEADGMDLLAAIKLVKLWNDERKRNGTEGIYSIPFVKEKLTS